MDYGWIMVIGIDPTCWIVWYGWDFWVIPRVDPNLVLVVLGSSCGMTQMEGEHVDVLFGSSSGMTKFGIKWY